MDLEQDDWDSGTHQSTSGVGNPGTTGRAGNKSYIVEFDCIICLFFIIDLENDHNCLG